MVEGRVSASSTERGDGVDDKVTDVMVDEVADESESKQ